MAFAGASSCIATSTARPTRIPSWLRRGVCSSIRTVDFAGIIIDVLFDHFLARDWARFCSLPLPIHVETVHAALHAHWRTLPPRLQGFATYLEREAVLLGYRRMSGVQTSYLRLARRSPAFAPLATALQPVLAREAELQQHFDRFFPALQGEVRRWSPR